MESIKSWNSDQNGGHEREENACVLDCLQDPLPGALKKKKKNTTTTTAKIKQKKPVRIFRQMERWSEQPGSEHFPFIGKPDCSREQSNETLLSSALNKPRNFIKVLGTGAHSIQPKFPVQLVEMQLERADQMKIFRNKQTIFGGTPPFPFQQVGTKITVPFVQNFRFCWSQLPCKLGRKWRQFFLMMW